MVIYLGFHNQTLYFNEKTFHTTDHLYASVRWNDSSRYISTQVDRMHYR